MVRELKGELAPRSCGVSDSIAAKLTKWRRINRVAMTNGAMSAGRLQRMSRRLVHKPRVLNGGRQWHSVDECGARVAQGVPLEHALRVGKAARERVGEVDVVGSHAVKRSREIAAAQAPGRYLSARTGSTKRRAAEVQRQGCGSSHPSRIELLATPWCAPPRSVGESAETVVVGDENHTLRTLELTAPKGAVHSARVRCQTDKPPFTRPPNT